MSRYAPSMTAAASPRRVRRAGSRRLVVGLGLTALVGLAAFAGGFAVFMESLDWAERPPVQGSDAIVALTGGPERIEDAIALLARGYGSRLLITGVHGRTGLEGIKRLNKEQHAAVECCVDLDHEARNTVGNAVSTSRWARAKGFQSLVIVTSNYHMPRAMLELDEALPEVSKVSYSVMPPSSATGLSAALSYRPGLFIGEYAKFLAVWARTRLLPGRSHAAERSGTSLANTAGAR